MLDIVLRLMKSKQNTLKSKEELNKAATYLPTLFNLFINDLIFYIKESNIGIPINNKIINILLYADDIVLIAENENDLAHLINRVNTWCNKNQMCINTEKTKILHIRKKHRQRSSYKFKCNHSNTPIEFCNEYKYLGIYFNEFLDMKVTIDHVATSARKAMSGIIARSRIIGGLMYKSYTQLFNSLVAPIIDYGSVIWGHTEHAQLSMIQKNAMRY